MITLKKLKAHGRLDLTILLIIMPVFCLVLSIARYFITDTKVFLFLNWNLFLAFIPWLASTIITINPRFGRHKLLMSVLLLVWILFFPNAPYILTDLFHLRLKTSAPIWFDLTLILSFAWTGLMYGFISLLDIENLLAKSYGNRFAWIATTLLLFTGSFGIYLGRYLRWNSWDIISDPGALLYDISVRFTDPLAHPRTWGMTVLMGLLLNSMFWCIKLLRQNYAVSKK